MRRICVVLFACFALLGLTLPDASAQDSWKFRVTPYIWTMAVHGKANLGGIPIDLHESIPDILREIDMALQFHVEARHGNLLVLADSHYAKVSKDIVAPPGKFSTRQIIQSAAAGYRFDERYDVYAGLRYYDIDMESHFKSVPNFGGEGKWADPIVGGRVLIPVGAKGALAVRGDIGGFGVGSKLAWMVQPSFTWKIKPNLAALVGYRVLDVNYESGQGAKAFRYDVRHLGPGIGMSLSF